jgi:hypothetical protein
MPIGQKFPEKRQWKIIKDSWVPEKSDHPLQGLNFYLLKIYKSLDILSGNSDPIRI